MERGELSRTFEMEGEVSGQQRPVSFSGVILEGPST
jgi:hypothetical protein